VKIYGFILGFQRFVWCPKCTPASSSDFMLTSLVSLPPSTGPLSGRASCAGCVGALTASNVMADCSGEVKPSEAPSISLFLAVAGVNKDFLRFRCCIFRRLHPPRHPKQGTT